MGRYGAAKTFRFCYGHRIPGHEGRCCDLHGHNARVEIVCRGDLDELGMVVDFGKINETVGAWIDEHWDHQMILWAQDPLIEMLREAEQPVFVMEQRPTAENMAAQLYRVAERAGLPVVAVRFWETDHNLATFEEE